jgi:hypothetical protein
MALRSSSYRGRLSSCHEMFTTDFPPSLQPNGPSGLREMLEGHVTATRAKSQPSCVEQKQRVCEEQEYAKQELGNLLFIS